MKRMKKGLYLISLIVTIFMLAACGAGGQEKHNEATQPTAPAAEPKKQKVLVYYSNNDLTAMQKEEHEIAYATDEEKYKVVMGLLGKPAKPENQPLWPNFAYHSIKLGEDGQLAIDADSKNQYNLGSSGELMAIEALRMTMFQFPEVKTIQILQDGKPVESLMGHVDVSQPIPR